MGRPNKPVHQERMAKKIYRPWTVARIHQARKHSLVEREWELRRLLQEIQQEIDTIKSRLPVGS